MDDQKIVPSYNIHIVKQKGETTMTRKTYQVEIETRICGIPCLVGVTYFHQDAGSWDCPPDTEVEYDILDRKGYRAEWLENKMDWKEEKKLYNTVVEYMCGY